MPHDVDRTRLQQLVAEGAQLVEVLPDEEYAWAHLPGAINIPLKELDDRIESLDADHPVVVYCNDTL